MTATAEVMVTATKPATEMEGRTSLVRPDDFVIVRMPSGREMLVRAPSNAAPTAAATAATATASSLVRNAETIDISLSDDNNDSASINYKHETARKTPADFVCLGKFGKFVAADLLGKLYEREYEITEKNRLLFCETSLLCAGLDQDTLYIDQTQDSNHNENEEDEEDADVEDDDKEDDDEEEKEEVQEQNQNNGFDQDNDGKMEKSVAEPQQQHKRARENGFASNKEIYDRAASNQKLTHQDILSLRDTCVDTEKVITVIAQGNRDFNLKTKFSKKKYLARKEKRFLKRIRLIQCDATSLCEFYYKKHYTPSYYKGDQPSAMALRQDIHALALNAAHIHEGSRVLVIDDTPGCVLACGVLERLGPNGKMVLLTDPRAPNSGALRGALAHLNKPFDHLVTITTWASSFPLTEEESGDLSSLSSSPVNNEHASSEPPSSEKSTKVTPLLYDSVVAATSFDAAQVYSLIEPLVNISRPIVFVSPCSTSALHELYLCLRSSSSHVLVQLQTTWYREYQVLPHRTHPLMRTSGHGGALLTATKVNKTPINIRKS